MHKSNFKAKNKVCTNGFEDPYFLYKSKYAQPHVQHTKIMGPITPYIEHIGPIFCPVISVCQLTKKKEHIQAY